MQTPTAPQRGSSEPATDQPPAKRSGRRGLRLAAWILIPLLLLALLIFVVPTYAARYVARSQLEAMGVTTEGINTLRIDVWNREMWLGPVQFRGEAAPFGQVEELGVKVGVTKLFQRQALIRELVIKGVDLQLTRETDGRLILNGVDLRRQGEQPKEPEEKGDPWGAGIDEVRIVDSRIFFTDRARGTVEINVASLELDEFRSWEPDHPGRFLLDATINNMEFRAQGMAKPFSGVASADLAVTVADVEIEKIARYTGPLGFDRRSGVLRADLTGTVEAAGGNVDGTVKGEIVQRDTDQSRPDQMALSFDEASLLLDHRFRLAGDGTSTVEGPLRFAIENAILTQPGGMKVQLGAGEINLPSLSVKTGAGRTELAADGAIQLEGVDAQPPSAGGASTSIVASDVRTEAKGLRLAAFSGGTEVSGAVSVAANALKLQAAQPGAAAPVMVAADRASVALSDLQTKGGGGQTSLQASGSVDVETLSAQVPGEGPKPPADAGAERLHVDLREISATLGEPLSWRLSERGTAARTKADRK
ncbi:MAG TPA: DUF748 domain-containing protein [Rhodospirillales bacterium]|nr:DUF748 domain-containing protein [Rhodospirillales bacterium]